jgi:predicted porin
MKSPRLSPLTLCLAGVFCTLPAQAQTTPTSPSSAVTVYGVIDIGLVHQNHPDSGIPVLVGTLLAQQPSLPIPFTAGAGYGSALGGNGLESSSGLNVAQGARSRLGIKATETLSSEWTARIELEHRFSPDTGGINGKEAVFWDKAIIGLTSSTWGDVSLGRDYMPAFYPQYVLDPWLNEGVAQMGANLYALGGYVNEISRFTRYNNGLHYKVKTGAFTGMVSMSMKEDTGSGVTRNFSNRRGFSAMYTQGPWFLGLGYDRSEVLAAGAKEDMWFAGVSYDAGFIKPRLSHTRTTLKAVGPYFGLLANPILGMGKSELHPHSWTLAATVPAGPSGVFKLGMTRLSWDEGSAVRTETKQRKYSLGYEHSLSKRTAIYTDVTQGKTAQLPTLKAWDLGIKHKF